MNRQNLPNSTLTLPRMSVKQIDDLVYGHIEMTENLAQTIRALRLEHRLSYDQVMWALCQSDPNLGQCVSYGKALIELACMKLNDFDPNWK